MDTITVDRGSLFIWFVREYKLHFTNFAKRYFGIPDYDCDMLMVETFNQLFNAMKDDISLIYNVRKAVETKYGKKVCVAYLRKRNLTMPHVGRFQNVPVLQQINIV